VSLILLAFRTRVYPCIKERAKQPSIAEQQPQELVVIDIDIMKTGRVEKVVAVDKDGYPPAMAKLPGRTRRGVELHFNTSNVENIGQVRVRRNDLDGRQEKYLSLKMRTGSQT